MKKIRKFYFDDLVFVDSLYNHGYIRSRVMWGWENLLKDSLEPVERVTSVSYTHLTLPTTPYV